MERDDLIQSGPTYPKLTQNTETDVLVVGGGMAGLQIAYELLLKGQKVILVEDGSECEATERRGRAYRSSYWIGRDGTYDWAFVF